MAAVGDRVEVGSQKGAARTGTVTASVGPMITVEWDSGGTTSLAPGPGVVTVLPGRRRSPSKSTATVKPTTTTVRPARKTEDGGARTATAPKLPRPKASAAMTAPKTATKSAASKAATSKSGPKAVKAMGATAKTSAKGATSKSTPKTATPSGSRPSPSKTSKSPRSAKAAKKAR